MFVACSCFGVSEGMTSSKNCSAPLYRLAGRPLIAVCLTRGIFLKTKVSTNFFLQTSLPSHRTFRNPKNQNFSPQNITLTLATNSKTYSTMDKQLKMTLKTIGNFAFNNNLKKSYLDSQRVLEQCCVCSVQNARS